MIDVMYVWICKHMIIIHDSSHVIHHILAPRVTQCGNFRIEDDEECDPGPAAVINDGDLCCTDECTLRSNFICRL